MKNVTLGSRFSVLVLGMAVLSLAVALFTGCESGEGTHALTVSPSYIDLTSTTTNMTLTFTVTDGLRDLSLPLEWRVSNATLGKIGYSAGESASYIVNTNFHGENTIIVKDQYDAEGLATISQ